MRDAAGLAQLQVKIDKGPSATTSRTPWTVRLAVGKLSNGRHTITFQARDKAGNTATLRRSIVIDNKKPTVRITRAPKNNAKLRKKVTIAAAAADNLVVNRVECWSTASIAGTKKAGYALSLNPKKYGRTFTVQLRAYDQAGNVAYSSKRIEPTSDDRERVAASQSSHVAGASRGDYSGLPERGGDRVARVAGGGAGCLRWPVVARSRRHGACHRGPPYPQPKWGNCSGCPGRSWPDCWTPATSPSEHLPDSKHRVVSLADVLEFQVRREHRRAGRRRIADAVQAAGLPY